MFYGALSHYIWHSATGEAHIIFPSRGWWTGRPTNARPILPRPTSRFPHNATTSPTQRGFARFPRRCLCCCATQQSPPSLRHPGPHAPKPSQHPTQPRENPCMERSWHQTTKHPGPRRRRVGWQPQFTSYIPGHDCPRGPHRLSRFRSAPTPTGEPTTSTSPRPHPSSRGSIQASWLLLLYCASPRCTYLLRMCSPNVTTDFANNHDFAFAACLRRLLAVDDLPAQALATAHLPLSQGGLGLTCASILVTPAFWSSWADSLPVLHTQLPEYAAQILEHLQHPSAAIPSIQAAAAAAQALEERGWTPPTWTELTQGIQPNTTEANTEEAPRTRGWQQQATTPVNTAMYNELQAAIPPASQAMLQSQAGPFASRAFTTIPYSAEFEYPSHLFRILLLRRLRHQNS